MECSAAAYLIHSVLAGIVSVPVGLGVRILLRKPWFPNPHIAEDALIGLIEGAIVTLLFCLRRGAVS